MNPVWWVRGVSRLEIPSDIAHALRDGKALCGTNLHKALAVGDPAFAGLHRQCKRCEKALVKLVPPPGEDRICRVFRLGGKDFRSRLYVVDIDGDLYHFDMRWYQQKLATDPDDWGIGSVLTGGRHKNLNFYGVTITVPSSWRPEHARHTARSGR